MTANIQPISKERHQGKSWVRPTDYRFASEALIVPLAANEAATAALSFSLAFGLINQQLTLVAVLGLNPGQNLFVAPNGAWAGGFTPAVIRTYPFRLLPKRSGGFTLGIDEASGLVVEGGHGEPFFHEDGRPHAGLQANFTTMVQSRRSQETAASACRALAEHGVIEPWPITVRDGNEERLMPGLSRISEAALNGLETDAFIALRQHGALALAYAQLMSMGNLGILGRLSDAHNKARAANRKVAEPSAPTFSLSDDTAGFDFGSVDWETR